MAFSVTLPRTCWGAADAPLRALLVHGLGSNGALMWRFAVELAAQGWHVSAVDLRGHGTAPRALDYSIDAYAADLIATTPAPHTAITGATASWDLVIGHSLGGASAVVASAAAPEWTTKLVLIDPALCLTEEDRARVAASQESSFEEPSAAEIRATHPHWHENDVELKRRSTHEVSRWAVEQTSAQNTPWDVRAAAAALAVPTTVIAADPALDSLFAGDVARGILASNTNIAMTVIADAGHSPHRDRPEETMTALRSVIAGA